VVGPGNGDLQFFSSPPPPDLMHYALYVGSNREHRRERQSRDGNAVMVGTSVLNLSRVVFLNRFGCLIKLPRLFQACGKVRSALRPFWSRQSAARKGSPGAYIDASEWHHVPLSSRGLMDDHVPTIRRILKGGEVQSIWTGSGNSCAWR
jgi:hypothetical protein